MTTDNATAPALLPCPFCQGSAFVYIDGPRETGIQCNGCDAQSGFYDTETAAIAAWNTRIPSPADRAGGDDPSPDMLAKLHREIRLHVQACHDRNGRTVDSTAEAIIRLVIDETQEERSGLIQALNGARRNHREAHVSASEMQAELEAIRAAPPVDARAGGWIACSEKSPVPGSYLVRVDRRNSNYRDCTMILTWDTGRWWDHNEKYEPVTHWMPLPKPPGDKP